MFKNIKDFLGPVNNTVKGQATSKEIVRSTVLGVVSGSTIWAVLSVLWMFIQSIVTDPNFVANFQSFIKLLYEKDYLALFVAVGTFILDFLRRKYLHGD